MGIDYQSEGAEDEYEDDTAYDETASEEENE